MSGDGGNERLTALVALIEHRLFSVSSRRMGVEHRRSVTSDRQPDRRHDARTGLPHKARARYAPLSHRPPGPRRHSRLRVTPHASHGWNCTIAPRHWPC